MPSWVLSTHKSPRYLMAPCMAAAAHPIDTAAPFHTSPTVLYPFWRQGTHLHIGSMMQHGSTLGQSSVLLFLCCFSLPNNSYIFICYFNCYWSVSWCFPSFYTSYRFQIFPVLMVVILENSDLEFFLHICEELLTPGYFWICHMLVSFDILHFSYWRNLKNE